MTKIGIIGLGKTGESLKKLCSLEGYKVLTFDHKNPRADFNDFSTFEDENFDVYLLSPGVSRHSNFLLQRRNQVDLVGEFDFCSKFLSSEITIAITGSIGKSTVSALLAHCLLALDSHCFLGGNFGVPFSQYVYELRSGSRPLAKYLVLEMSSYQIENLKTFKPNFAILTYLSPNHLDRYSSLQEYFETKWSLMTRALDKVFLNESSEELKNFLKEKKIDTDNKFYFSNVENLPSPFLFKKTQLLGVHNFQNLSIVANFLDQITGVSPDVLSAWESFSGLEHRCEKLTIRFLGAVVVNDSKATSIESILSSVKSVEDSFDRIHLLLGGVDKELPWEQLNCLLEFQKQGRLIISFFGRDAEKIKSKSSLMGTVFSSLKECLQDLKLRFKEDVLLLSPGGASFDEFKNFEERGTFFKDFIARSFESK